MNIFSKFVLALTIISFMGCLPTNSEEEEEELEPLRFSYEVMGRSKSANYTVVINYRKYDFLSEEYSSGSTTVNRGPSDRWGGCCNYPQRLFFNEYNVIELDATATITSRADNENEDACIQISITGGSGRYPIEAPRTCGIGSSTSVSVDVQYDE